MIEGLCGEHTAQKQTIFSKFIEHHINIVKRIYEKNGGQRKEYLYFDVFAGPGYIVNCKYYEGPTSALKFHQLMSLENIKYKIIVAEIDIARRSSLQDILITENAPFTLKEDAIDCCPKYYHKWHFGLAYIDPPMTVESFLLTEQLLKDFSEYCPQIDIMIYITAAYMKRFKGMGHVPFDTRLLELMKCAKNKDWVVRKPIGSQQYTFLVGTKITKDLTWALWANEKFHRADSYNGKKILTRLNYNEKEQLFKTYKMAQKRMF